MSQYRGYGQTIDPPERQQNKIESDLQNQTKDAQVADYDGLFIDNADPGHDDAKHIGQEGYYQYQVDPGEVDEVGISEARPVEGDSDDRPEKNDSRDDEKEGEEGNQAEGFFH